MTLKDQMDKAVKDVRDGTDEALHRGAADAEKARREAEADEMTSGEKLESMANEAKHRAQAGVDATKRTIRDNT
jgi:hypothetical protein